MTRNEIVNRFIGERAALKWVWGDGATIRSRQGYRYKVTAVGRWHFLATHADDDEQTEFIFAIEGWRERFEVEG